MPSSASSFSQAAYDYILDALQRGIFSPGQDVSAANIAATLDISRVPVREAIIRLENEGYLNSFPKKGTFVAKYSFHDILDTYNIRLMLEPPLIAGCCRDITPAELEKLQLFRAYNQKYADDTSYVEQSGEFFIQDTNLHLFLFSLPRNHLFEQIATKALTQCIISKAGMHDRLKVIHRDVAVSHIQFIDAFCAADQVSAERIMYNHLSEMRKSLIEYYTKR